MKFRIKSIEKIKLTCVFDFLFLYDQKYFIFSPKIWFCGKFDRKYQLAEERKVQFENNADAAAMNTSITLELH